MKVSLIIPAHNEAGSIEKVLRGLPKNIFHQIIVVNNGSTDDTAELAKKNGAEVVDENILGYGRACLAGMRALKDPEIVMFMDADASDDPKDVPSILNPILKENVDFVIGSRALGNVEKGAMTAAQLFGNWLATGLMVMLWGHRYYDLGPFRAIRYSSLEKLHMKDKNYGWTVEMQIKAVQKKLTIKEIPVSYHKRIGISKISGTIKGVLGAGYKIIFTIFKLRFGF